jgi:hypothetical protein
MLQRKSRKNSKLQYHEDFDTNEILEVAQPNIFSSDNAAKERARLARKGDGDGVDKSKRDRKNKAQESLDKLQYHEDYDTKGRIEVAQPNFFSSDSAGRERAQLARQRRDEVDKSKRDRKNKVLESLDSLGDFEYSFNHGFQVDDKLDEKKSRQCLLPLQSASKSSSINSPSPPSAPQAPPKSRLPYHYRKDEDSTQLDGKIVPSDQAFSDMILDDGQALPAGSVWADFITVESLTDKVSEDSLNFFSYVYTHTMRYNGEVIWTMETRSNCDSKGTWGQSSSCIISHREGLLRLKIIHKGRRNLGEGWNTREKRVLKLADLIRQSGEARQEELMCQ